MSQFEFPTAPEPGDSVCIRSCRDNMEANMVRSILADAGIRCFVQGENHRAMLGAMGPYIDLRVLVAERDAERALEILRELDRSAPLSEEEKKEGDSDEEREDASQNLVFRVQPKRRPPSPIPSFAAVLCGAALLYSGAYGLGGGMCLMGVLLFLGNRVVGRSAGQGGRCSTPSCQEFIPAEAETCPKCGGKVVGAIEHADQRLSALEAMRRKKSSASS